MKFEVLRPVSTAIAGKQRMWIYCRMNYQIATAGIANTASVASIHKATRFSDHAPLTIDYDFKL